MNPKWTYVSFKTLFEWQPKSRIKSGAGKKNGKYKMFVCSDIEVKRFDEYLESNESLVFGTGGKASCHFVNEPFAYSTDCVVAQKRDENINSRFYYYFFRQRRLEMLQGTFTGSGLQHTSKKKIENLEVPVVDKEEQDCIVTKIEELLSQIDDGVENFKKIKEQLNVYRQTILVKAFEDMNETELLTIDQVCEKIVDCPHSTPEWVEEGELCLRTTNFKRGYLDLQEKNYVTKETFNLRNTRLVPEPGDVLYSREGTVLGIACIIPDNLHVCLGQRMMLFRTSEIMNNKYLMFYLNSPIVTNHVTISKGGTGSPHINVGDVKKYKIPVPNIKCQNKIVEDLEYRMSVCDNIEQTVNNAILQADILRQSILKKAFEGGL